MTEGLDLYDDVLTTGGELPEGIEEEALQTQVRITKNPPQLLFTSSLSIKHWSLYHLQNWLPAPFLYLQEYSCCIYM